MYSRFSGRPALAVPASGHPGHGRIRGIPPRPVLLVLLVLLALLALGLSSCAESPKPPLKLSVAVCPTYFSGLIALAGAKGYFTAFGLDVAFTECASGNYCLEALDAGQAQMATVTDFAFADRALKAPPLELVASIGSADNHEIVARRDCIDSPGDLKGKRIGVTFGTSAHYFLHTFLLSHSIEPSAVTAVNMKPGDLASALDRGEVDAISCWDVFAWQARKQLGNRASAWRVKVSQDIHWVLATPRDAPQHHEATRRFLQAVLKAQEELVANEAKAKEIIAAKLRFDREFMEQYWTRYRLTVSLPKSLVISLDNSLRWHMAGLGQGGDAPDPMELIDAKALTEIHPGAVTLYR